jgi:hypothetical protein
MSSKSETAQRMAAARAAGQRHSTAPAGAEDGDQAPPDGAAVRPRTQPVKVTVELQPMEHRQLRRFCARAEDDLGLTNVAGAEVFRVLWQLAQEDERLAAKVLREIKRTGGNRRRT